MAVLREKERDEFFMLRPRLFRDPIHHQIRFDRVDLGAPYPSQGSNGQHVGWLLPNLINSQAFQRLRHIRQNGLTNLVFPGMEHSRFSHSIGVSHLAGVMYDSVIRNSERETDDFDRLSVITAGLVHDIGHGPFSHAMEEVLEEVKVPFHHEQMTVRILLEDKQVHDYLRSVSTSFPERIAAYIDKQRRTADRWTYRLISSQLDADRIDYLLRDSRNAGLLGHGFDVPRLLDMLSVEENHVVVHRHATEAVEAYLIMLSHMYQAIYFHRGVRGAIGLLRSTLKRAVDLHREGSKWVFPDGVSGNPHPFKVLIEQGNAIDVDIYTRFCEFHIWSLIEDWQYSSEKDKILSDLASRLMRRQSFRAVEFDPDKSRRAFKMNTSIIKLISDNISFVDEKQAQDYYFLIDEPSRVAYKLYEWERLNPGEGPADDAIWLYSPEKESRPVPIENELKNPIFTALKGKKYYHRVMFPAEIYEQVMQMW